MERWLSQGALPEDRDFISRTHLAANNHEYTYFTCVSVVCVYVHVSCMWIFTEKRRSTGADVTILFYPLDLMLGTKLLIIWKSSKSSEPLSHLPCCCIFLSHQWNKFLLLPFQIFFSVTLHHQNCNDVSVVNTTVNKGEWLHALCS